MDFESGWLCVRQLDSGRIRNRFLPIMSLVQVQRGKGTYVQVGCSLRAGPHNSHFDFDEQTLANALELMSRCVYRTLAK